MTDFVNAYLIPEKCAGHRFREDPILVKPSIGEVYKVVYYCDPFHHLNYFVTVTPENIDFLTNAMNDPANDITEYQKKTRMPGGRR